LRLECGEGREGRRRVGGAGLRRRCGDDLRRAALLVAATSFAMTMVALPMIAFALVAVAVIALPVGALLVIASRLAAVVTLEARTRGLVVRRRAGIAGGRCGWRGACVRCRSGGRTTIVTRLATPVMRIAMIAMPAFATMMTPWAPDLFEFFCFGFGLRCGRRCGVFGRHGR
jgi:uncharacterized protein (DUF983 family)